MAYTINDGQGNTETFGSHTEGTDEVPLVKVMDGAEGTGALVDFAAMKAALDELAAAINASRLDVSLASLPALAAGSNNIGDVDVLTLPALPGGTNAIGKLVANDGVDIGDVTVNNASLAITHAALTELAAAINGSRLDVSLASLPALAAGTNTIGKLGANSGVDIGDVDVTSIAAGTNRLGVVAPYAAPGDLVSGVTAAITGTANTSVIAAQGASTRIYVTSLTVINSHASVGTVVELKDGTTVIHRGYAKAEGGGYTITFPDAPLRGTANTALNAACVTTGSNVYVSASGFKATF